MMTQSFFTKTQRYERVHTGFFFFLAVLFAISAYAPGAIITQVARTHGQSGERDPVGAFDGDTPPLPTPDDGLKEGDLIYSDRTFWWVNIPQSLLGSDYIRVFNNDKATDEIDVTYTVTTSAAATVWVAIDTRAAGSSNWGETCPWAATAPGSLQPVVDWITSEFAEAGTFRDTGLTVGIRESASTLRTAGVFSAVLEAGTYVFGAMPNNSICMYTIGAIPAIHSQVILSADGPGNTYELIASVLGGNPMEVPDCGHPEFGRHITEQWDDELGKYVFVFHIHVEEDDDRCTNFDRQRNEIKTYGPSPEYVKGRYNDVHTYRWKFKLDEEFQPSPNFTHIFQIKAGDGSDSGAPIITLTPRYGSPQRMQLIFTPSSGASGGGTKTSPLLDPFKGEWIEAYVRALYAENGAIEVVLTRIRDGAVLMSYTHDNLDMWRDNATFNRPKWGIYRSLNSPQYLRDEQVRFADFCIAKGYDICPSDVPTYSPTGLAAVSDAAQVKLSWIADPKAARYNVKRAPQSGGPYAIIAAGVTATEFIDAEVRNGMAYYYVVSSVGPSGEMGTSNEVRATPRLTFFFEAEDLVRSAVGAGMSLQSDSQNSGGIWVALEAAAAGPYIEYILPNIPAGTYLLKMGYKGHPNRGILQAAVNGGLIGEPLDQYFFPSSYPEHTFGNVTFTSGGDQIIRLTVIGKNPSAGTYTLSSDTFKLIRLNHPADLDADGRVDYADFAILSAQWLTDGTWVPSADMAPDSGDGLVGLADLIMLCEEWLMVY